MGTVVETWASAIFDIEFRYRPLVDNFYGDF